MFHLEQKAKHQQTKYIGQQSFHFADSDQASETGLNEPFLKSDMHAEYAEAPYNGIYILYKQEAKVGLT